MIRIIEWQVALKGEPQRRIYSRSEVGGRLVTSFAPVPGVVCSVILEESWDGILS